MIQVRFLKILTSGSSSELEGSSMTAKVMDYSTKEQYFQDYKGVLSVNLSKIQKTLIFPPTAHLATTGLLERRPALFSDSTSASLTAFLSFSWLSSELGSFSFFFRPIVDRCFISICFNFLRRALHHHPCIRAECCCRSLVCRTHSGAATKRRPHKSLPGNAQQLSTVEMPSLLLYTLTQPNLSWKCQSGENWWLFPWFPRFENIHDVKLYACTLTVSICAQL